jgi:Ca2+-transporting ATPase
MIGSLALLAFGIGAVHFDPPGSHMTATTMCFATLSMSQLFHAFNMRSEESIMKLDVFGNIYLVGALVIGIIMQVSVISVPSLSAIFKVAPLNRLQWLVVGMLCVMPIIVVELQKAANAIVDKRKVRLQARKA